MHGPGANPVRRRNQYWLLILCGLEIKKRAKPARCADHIGLSHTNRMGAGAAGLVLSTKAFPALLSMPASTYVTLFLFVVISADLFPV